MLVLGMLWLLSLVPNAHAQLEVGLKAGGGNSSFLHVYGRCPADKSDCIEAAQPNQPRRGAAAGVFLRIRPERLVSLQPELLYVQKGYEVTGPTLHLSYVEMPVLIRVDLRDHDASGIRPFLFGGPAPAFLTSCTVFGNSVSGPFRDSCGESSVTSTGDDTSSYDLGVVVGGGIALDRFAAELRHTHSLVDVGAWGRHGKTTNRTLTLFLGYAVPISW